MPDIELPRVDLDQIDLEPVEIEEPSPLDALPDTGSLEGDCDQEVDAIAQSFRKRTARDERRFKKATDSEYWVCLCFQTREQVEAFLYHTGWANPSEKYVDGVAVARKLKIQLPPDEIGYPPIRHPKRWSELT